MVRITVIIPTRNRGGDLTRCLAGLSDCARRLEVSPGRVSLHEVIVVDDASDTAGAAAPAREAGLPTRVLRNRDRCGAGASRRRAAEVAEGGVLAFLDDDAVPRGDWLLQAALVDGEHPAVTGRVLRFDDGLLSSARQARYDARYGPLEKDSPVGFFAGGNSAVLTDVFHEVGGFSNEGTGGDNSLAASLAERGTPVAFRPDLVIAHRNGKGWQRALADAWNAGLQHPDAMSLPEGVQAVRECAVGEIWTVRQTNRLLGALHAAGRVASGHLRGQAGSAKTTVRTGEAK